MIGAARTGRVTRRSAGCISTRSARAGGRAPRALHLSSTGWSSSGRTRRPVCPAGPEPRSCTGVPGTFNLDSFGYNAHVIRKQPQELSWAELLNRKWRGRVALVGDPLAGFQDAGNAAQAAGLVRIRDLGDPTRREIDVLFKLLIALKPTKALLRPLGGFRDARELDEIGRRGDRVDVGGHDLAARRPRLPGSPGGAARGLPRLRRPLLDLERRHRPGKAPRLLRLRQLVALRAMQARRCCGPAI